MRPYESKNGDGGEIREFPDDVDPSELRWHQDGEDRIVTPLESNGWMIQFDNEDPVLFDSAIFIPAQAWHRVIRGNGPLKIRIDRPKITS